MSAERTLAGGLAHVGAIGIDEGATSQRTLSQAIGIDEASSPATGGVGGGGANFISPIFSSPVVRGAGAR